MNRAGLLEAVELPVVPGVVEHWSRGRVPASSGRAPGVAVVLCTYQRADSAGDFLRSLALQTRPIDQLVVVDASRDAATEAVVAALVGVARVEYWRVTEPLRGLTVQRNFGLDSVAFDLVAFFDDDVVLDADCIRQLELVLRQRDDVVGVGCFAETAMSPSALWRLRQALRIVGDLTPGRYTRSGMSVPWRFHAPTQEVVEGDWLPGCAMLLRTSTAQRIGFDGGLSGYAQGEDLDFSLRLRRQGRLAMAGAARCQHFHAPEGRPNAFRIGRMEIANRYRIWRRVHERPSVADHLVFTYAWGLDTVLLLRDAVRPGRAADGVRRIAGRVAGAIEAARRRPV